MAKLFPNIEIIKNLRPAPTEGELHCLKILQEKLSDDFEVYFQPYINGDNPDIIILKKNAGVFIIEVKDWNFDSYVIDHQVWRLKRNNVPLRSPLEQVRNYKDNLYNLHINGLLEKKISDKRLYSLIQTAVYFHCENQDNIDLRVQNKDAYIKLYGHDSIMDINDSILKSYGGQSFFTEDLYEEFRRFLKPTFHMIEEGKDIVYSQKQEELSISEQGKQQKIKGVAGSGKTLVLAKRAVNAHKRTKKKVLILSFNITLINYIHDKISGVREVFHWRNFYIASYHNFINSQTNNLNISFKSLSDYEDLNLFEDKEHCINKYDAIFIDEIQDYKTEWINIIKNNFLAEGGEFVVFGDEKQNIYSRKLDSDKKPNTTIPGRWAELSESYRLNEKIAKLSSRFQKEFFKDKYSYEELQIVEQESLFSDEDVEYFDISNEMSVDELFQKMWRILIRKSIHPNDVCILSSKIALLRKLDFYIRQAEKTRTTFEAKEIFEKLESGSSNLDRDLKKVRKNKKFNFWMNPGTSKLSTIHSFKGWEAPTLFLIIDSNENNDELIYTALTRCRKDLFIINIGNHRYGEFFLKNKDLVKVVGENDGISESPQVEVLVSEKEETLEELEREELNILFPSLLENLKGQNNKFKICVLGEISGNKDDFESNIGSFFNKYSIKATQWDVEFINNRKLKNTSILKSFKRGQSGYSLLITGQIHQHSSKDNSKANLLEELRNPKYINMIIGSSPSDKLSIDNLLEKLDDYFQEKMED